MNSRISIEGTCETQETKQAQNRALKMFKEDYGVDYTKCNDCEIRNSCEECDEYYLNPFKWMRFSDTSKGWRQRWEEFVTPTGEYMRVYHPYSKKMFSNHGYKDLREVCNCKQIRYEEPDLTSWHPGLHKINLIVLRTWESVKYAPTPFDEYLHRHCRNQIPKLLRDYYEDDVTFRDESGLLLPPRLTTPETMLEHCWYVYTEKIENDNVQIEKSIPELKKCIEEFKATESTRNRRLNEEAEKS